MRLELPIWQIFLTLTLNHWAYMHNLLAVIGHISKIFRASKAVKSDQDAFGHVFVLLMALNLMQFLLVWGFEPGCIKCHCFKHILYHTICFIPKQGQILCIELHIKLKKMWDKCPNTIPC